MMPKIQTILYCTQMGPRAPQIFRYALALAESFAARIVVLHVHETLRPSQSGMVEGYAGKGALESAVIEEERHEVADLRQRIQEFFTQEMSDGRWERFVEEIVVAEGRATAQILRYVEKTGADLVVMGSHRHNLLEALLGSTSQGVIAKGRVPVLVVPIEER